jgi:hypothetical protein
MTHAGANRPELPQVSSLLLGSLSVAQSIGQFTYAGR